MGSEVEGEVVRVSWECWTMVTGTLMEGRHTDYWRKAAGKGRGMSSTFSLLYITEEQTSKLAAKSTLLP